jgi:hypothetical protein
MAKTALKQINDKGRTIIVSMPSDLQVYDPATDTFTSGTDETQTVKGLFTNFNQKDIDGELIKQSDNRVLIPASSLTEKPTTKGTVIDESVVYSIQNVDEVRPGDVAILYMVQVRR